MMFTDLTAALRACDGGMYELDVQVGGDLGHVLAGEVAAVIDIEDVREPVHRPPRSSWSQIA